MNTTHDKHAPELPPLTLDEGRLLRLLQNRKSAKHARPRKPTARRAMPPARLTAILCPTCNQDMTQAPHEGPVDCPQCGQGIRRKPAVLLTQLVANWRILAESLKSAGFRGSALYTRQCARDLQRLLKT